ncbi:winged helix domain-containing protein [Prosthecodimorpha staleyi]|uniref:winged helix domain-containing protein n=1 Tax=Prosthecodimorpha staleyi TaxID=2840188 RepID=UPI0028F73E23|nr:hypothetical protein [Prosthecodimorpha staleyi]
MKAVLQIHYRANGEAGTRTARGRYAWALLQLAISGDRGCTPITHPGPRWSSYVHRLRQGGLAIETIYEAHAGPFAGNHARYVLRTPVVILGGDDAEAA